MVPSRLKTMSARIRVGRPILKVVVSVNDRSLEAYWALLYLIGESLILRPIIWGHIFAIH